MKTLVATVPLLGFLGMCILLMFWDAPSAYLSEILSGLGPLRYVAFISILVLAVVFVPLSAMPIIPMAAMTLGPLATALCSVAGWTLGSIAAFLIARYIGRPAIDQFVSFDTVDALAASLPKRSRFMAIVLIRLVMPVDLASYALGLSKNIGVVEYTGATILGVIWFSFAFAYLGEAFITGNALFFAVLGGLSLVIFVAAWRLLRQKR